MAVRLEMKTLSSLEKCFLDSALNQFPAQRNFTIFHNQPLVFQVGLHRNQEVTYKTFYSVRLEGALAAFSDVRLVTNLPCEYPCIASNMKGEYLRHTPGLYPDLLRPLHYDNGIWLLPSQTQALWITARAPESLQAGVYDLTVILANSKTGEVCAQESVTVRILEQNLPAQKLIHTEWFYTDCLANAYHARAFSERHWRNFSPQKIRRNTGSFCRFRFVSAQK